MCNLYTARKSAAEIASLFSATARTDLPGDRDLYPKSPAPIVRLDAGARVVEQMSWGWPLQVRGKRIVDGQPQMLTKHVTNVRNLDSAMWRSAVADPERRCLVPFTRFSEYGQVRGADGKLPLHWFRVPSRSVAAFAGVWRPGPDGPVFAFLTTEPNSLIAPIHPKAMPVILADEDYDQWLTGSADEARALQSPFPAQLMEAA